MQRRDELPARLRAAFEEHVAADVEPLLAEARAEARAEVKAQLREAYAGALLARAERAVLGARVAGPPPARPAAPPEQPAPAAEAGDALWLYCVVPAGRRLPDGVDGVGGAGPIALVDAGELAGVVSPVPLDEFGEEALRENLNDLGWLEATVRAHEAVLDSLLAEGPVVPMRVCTIYRGEEQVRSMLEDQRGVLAGTLERLAGRTEWGVKIVADRRRLEERARLENEEARALGEQASGAGGGGAYIARKKLAALVREEADAMLGEMVRETHARLEEWAVASVVLPAQSRELAGYEGEMVFNGAYLVDDERAEQFRDLIGELEAQYGPAGLVFELTGPWPAYNFADARIEARR